MNRSLKIFGVAFLVWVAGVVAYTLLSPKAHAAPATPQKDFVQMWKLEGGSCGNIIESYALYDPATKRQYIVVVSGNGAVTMTGRYQ